MKYIAIAVFAALFAGAFALEFDRPCRLDDMRPRVKQDFQVLAYTGLWYEIFRYEAQNQTEMDCVNARYTLNLDGSVQVDNTGWTPAGQFTQFIGRAVVSQEGASTNRAMLDVTFFEGQPPSIYWVMATDYSNYAVVWSCRALANNRSNEVFWVLHRTPTVSGTVMTRINEVLTINGAVFDRLRETDHDEEFCAADKTF